jgi:hypothetical protein
MGHLIINYKRDSLVGAYHNAPPGQLPILPISGQLAEWSKCYPISADHLPHKLVIMSVSLLVSNLSNHLWLGVWCGSLPHHISRPTTNACSTGGAKQALTNEHRPQQHQHPLGWTLLATADTNVDHMTLDFNNKMFTAAVFLDFKKAFDNAWHPGLLYKLSNLYFWPVWLGLLAPFFHNTNSVFW